MKKIMPMGFILILISLAILVGCNNIFDDETDLILSSSFDDDCTAVQQKATIVDCSTDCTQSHYFGKIFEMQSSDDDCSGTVQSIDDDCTLVNQAVGPDCLKAD